MERSKVVRMLLVSLVILGLGLVVSPAAEPAPAIGGRSVVALQRPPFLSAASAQESPEQLDIGEYLDEEAGIAAWYDAPGSITLSQVRSLFCPDPDNCTIEIETEDYIIGSINLPNYLDLFDVHVYVHRDGWIVVYYLNTDLSAKMLDVKARTIVATNFTTIISMVAGAGGVPFYGETYYDFRNPAANRILLVVEDDVDGDYYSIWMPTIFAYAERTWAKYNPYEYCSFDLDGTQMTTAWKGDDVCLGAPISPSYLTPGVTHWVSDINDGGSDYAVLMIIYAEFPE